MPVEGAVDGSSIEVAGTVTITSPRFTGSTSGGGTAPRPRPVLASADWWTEASNRFATVVPDRSRWREHGIPAVTPYEIPDGTYLMGETIADPRRPRIPDHPRLTFANGVRIMWRANHGLPNGWQPIDTNPTGYSDSMAHQAIEDDGLTDALEAGLRKDPDDGLVRYFVDEVTAGEDPNAPEGDTQIFSDPLDPELYQGVRDFMVEVDWPTDGQRRYRFYVPNPAATDRLTPGEAVEAWELHSTATRTAGPGFYDSGLDWYLGDSMVLTDYLRLFDLGTGDLVLDFQAAEAVGGGWTDEAGNPWTHGDDTTPHVAVAPDDLILLPSTTIPSRAADPGAGDWTLMYDGVIDPAADLYRLGTAGVDIVGDTGWGIYVIPAEYGGTQLIFNDGTTLVSAPLGITDADRHLILARLDRTAGTLEVTVDGEAVTVTGDAGALGRIAGVEDFTLAIGTVLRGLAVWSRCLTDDEAAALVAEVAAPAPAFDPVGSATGGGAQGPTGPAGPAGADGADGQDGAPGADGASAYEVAVADGFMGDESAWLASLVGPDGATGAKGDKGDKGDTGNPGPAGADGSDATVTYGLTAATAAEGIAIVHTTWRSGSYYGPTVPRVANAGQTLASGEARAMPFYNPVAGRTIDQLAVDVQAGSAGTGILYAMADDGNGYPGATLASASIPVSPTSLTSSTRAAATVTGSTYVLPRGMLWLVAHGTGTAWSGLTLDGQSSLMPTPASYSTGGISCWRVTGAGTTAFASFPAGGQLSTGVLVLMRAA